MILWHSRGGRERRLALKKRSLPLNSDAYLLVHTVKKTLIRKYTGCFPEVAKRSGVSIRWIRTFVYETDGSPDIASLVAVANVIGIGIRIVKVPALWETTSKLKRGRVSSCKSKSVQILS